MGKPLHEALGRVGHGTRRRGVGFRHSGAALRLVQVLLGCGRRKAGIGGLRRDNEPVRDRVVSPPPEMLNLMVDAPGVAC